MLVVNGRLRTDLASAKAESEAQATPDAAHAPPSDTGPASAGAALLPMSNQAGDGADPRLWSNPDLLEAVVGLLPPNEVAASVRLTCKAAAARFSAPHHTTVRLWEPVPRAEFARRWCATGALRSLARAQRTRLLCLVARSGDVENLEAAVAVVGCALSAEVLKAAASAGRVEACRWLLQRDCPGQAQALEAAAEAGQEALLDLLTYNDEYLALRLAVPYAAARGGHVGLMERLLAAAGLDARSEPAPLGLLAAAAHGCDLPTLQRLHGGAPRRDDGLFAEVRDPVLQAAAGSPTRCWRAKVEWLEEWGHRPDAETAILAGVRPDAAERLLWLRQRGWPLGAAGYEAARVGNEAALRIVLEAGVGLGETAATYAARNGHLCCLRALVEHDRPLPADLLRSAAEGGRLPVLEWAAGLAAGQAAWMALGSMSVMNAAVRSGRLEVMAWLRQQAGGCLCGQAVVEAADRGSEAVLRWLLAEGCPMPETGEPYIRAASYGDLATLLVLRELGVPWAANGQTFTDAVLLKRCDVPALEALLQLGCPVHWPGVVDAARSWLLTDAVSEWLGQQEEQHQGGGGPRAGA
ncbi:hypothetical protein TSOC_010502 [Tetrabaena socialis]|uniref:Ankyrin repeat domain-containing protein n=1 Tax=Tetrabaena socialis TaxID=47790 RepID=A0A2J7ZT37_9CHLO|nr:hypothetical protein TSOC_010502 [Tetrabaena socialis]|eukprot:PNH03433.1 hypothetical protein TSOC_010502 [Tetrabaena socialis]